MAAPVGKSKANEAASPTALVSMPTAVGSAALDALKVRRVRLGPVVADTRHGVMRIGFLLAPGSASDADALGQWAARLGAALGVRVGGGGTTATLPPLFPAWHGWLRWLVPPGTGNAATWTPAAALLSALTEGAAFYEACDGSGH